MKLLTNSELERSEIVANCRMNRERTLDGSNGYSKELGLHPVEFLRDIAQRQGTASWLDLCCGSGLALVVAARQAQQLELRLKICGVDLVDLFVELPSELDSLTFVTASLSEWQPQQTYDLITCVHGLHYIGDKLGLLARVRSWLTRYGLFVANFDLASAVLDSGPSRSLTDALMATGFDIQTRQKRISCVGRQQVDFPFVYLGADDTVGPNYTGQPAVTGHYVVRNSE